jgi:hypothetical protein
LIRSQPVPDPGSQPLRTLHSSYACRQLGAQEAGIRRLIGEASNGGEPNVDRRRSEIPLFQEEPISKHDGSIEREARLRTIPPDELIDGVSVGFLRTRRPRANSQQHFSNVPGPGTEGSSLAYAFSLSSANVPYWRPPVPRAQYGARNEHIRSRNAVSGPLCGSPARQGRVGALYE